MTAPNPPLKSLATPANQAKYRELGDGWEVLDQSMDEREKPSFTCGYCGYDGFESDETRTGMGPLHTACASKAYPEG